MRIASLLPGATEMVAALGLGSSLVAVSHECDHPPEVAGLPRITGSWLKPDQAPADIDEAVSSAVREGRPLYRVDGEMLERLKPELVVTQGVCEVCAVTGDTVRAVGSTVPMLSLTGASFEGVLEDLSALGEATGVDATPVVARLRARWAALPGGGSVRVMMLEWPDPPYYGGHWVPEQVERAGGVDVMGKAGERSGRTTWEAIAEADPDVLVSIACGFDLSGNVHHLQGTPKLRASKWACDANAHFSRPGPRLVDGAEILAAILRDPAADRVDGAVRVG